MNEKRVEGQVYDDPTLPSFNIAKLERKQLEAARTRLEAIARPTSLERDNLVAVKKALSQYQ